MAKGFFEPSTIVLVGFVLVIVGVYWHTRKVREGFIYDPNAQQCGVAHPPCPFGTACMNGWCVGTNPPALPPTTGLPVLPTPQQTSTALIFK
jgi:hypothetical protein